MNQRPYITEQKLEFLVQQKPISNFLSEILFLWNWNNWTSILPWTHNSEVKYEEEFEGVHACNWEPLQMLSGIFGKLNI